MSWFVGGIGNFLEDDVASIKSLTPNSILSFSSQDFFLIVGGNKQTCFYDVHCKDQKVLKWLVVGMGISSGTTKKFLNREDWKKIINSSEKETIDVDGHYILLTWNDTAINFSTDRVGLRDFYYCKVEAGNILFSTRADWLARLTSAKVNFKEFGSRWLLHNQISQNSVFCNINRVVCGGKLKIVFKDNKLIETKYNWLPITFETQFDEKDFNNSLSQLTTFPFFNHNLSLSFSGGLDSRLLFSILSRNRNENWYAHSFGNPNHPDSIIARNICSDKNIRHEQINLPIPAVETFVSELKEYSSQTLVNNSASLFCQQRNYNWFYDKEVVLIDGGFGEIWRRQFNNRLALLGKRDILRRNFKKIVQFISYYRADFFTEDIKKEMIVGCEEQISALFSLLPDPNKIEVNNWIDLYSIKTRLVNYYLHEQTRIDSIIRCYTPFVQPSLLQNVLLLKSSQKKNGRLFRKQIEKQTAYLTNYYLVKGNIAHPFWLTSMQSRIWSLIKQKSLYKNNSNDTKSHMIEKMKETMCDMITSKEVREYGIYDIRKLDFLNNALNKNTPSKIQLNELDWWISFELFRQQISGK